MVAKFVGSRTENNLFAAFVGESQARNRYSFAASFFASGRLKVLEKLFLFVADQEKQHAKIFYNFLSSFGSDREINIEGASYPVDVLNNSVGIFEKSQRNELVEHELYKEFGEEARYEGFSEISKKFLEISEIEKSHGERFGEFAGLLRGNELFACKSGNSCWLCLECGKIYNGCQAPQECPVCGHPFGYFLKKDLSLL
ncbi:MAG: rubrerythrin family protein [Oscillospiraceae bacterium]|nr:rubrerythrin family protein [Oscillospiraceae bacterium]